MIQTKYGTFNGGSWEDLFQRVFKLKYGDQNYQEMPASPGDYGIEGFVLNTGIAFQCYCPDRLYSVTELYEKQRDKITKDLGKLKTYQSAIAARLGTEKLSEWVFVTPDITHNDLVKHSRTKETEVRSWNLPILTDDFRVVLKDADHFGEEIKKIYASTGTKLTFLEAEPILSISDNEDLTEYELNISRKNKKRCIVDGNLQTSQHQKLNEITIRKLFEGESLFKKIEKEAAEIYFQILRVINQYEDEVDELSVTWQGSPEELIQKVRSELATRLKESISLLGETDIYKIADHMTSKWLALCPLSIE